eukprot:UN02915
MICDCTETNCGSSVALGIFIGFIVLLTVQGIVVVLLYYYKDIQFCVKSNRKDIYHAMDDSNEQNIS